MSEKILVQDYLSYLRGNWKMKDNNFFNLPVQSIYSVLWQ